MNYRLVLNGELEEGETEGEKALLIVFIAAQVFDFLAGWRTIVYAAM